MDDKIKDVVFDIERYAIHDGPGIRTLIFLKGCPLRCEWCANPESQIRKIQTMYYGNKCKGCGRCIDVCPQKAIRSDREFGLLTDIDICTGCGVCTDACYYGARRLMGKMMSVDDVMETVEKDIEFYKQSGGGITISGGEPLNQAEFLKSLLTKAKDRDIHTAIETCGFWKWQDMENIIPFLNLIFFDIKHIDPYLHKKYTGVDNELIISNLTKLDKVFKQIIIRIPYIPGYNDNIETQRGIYKLVSRMKNIERIEVLPYHRLGIMKYQGLGIHYNMEGVEQVDKERIGYLSEIGREYGVNVKVGT